MLTKGNENMKNTFGGFCTGIGIVLVLAICGVGESWTETGTKALAAIVVIVSTIVGIAMDMSGKSTSGENDYKYMEETFPGMLKAFKEAENAFSTYKNEFIHEYRAIPIVDVVGDLNNSCYRLQIRCGSYMDDSWKEIFPAGWYERQYNGEYYICKNIHMSHSVYASGHEWFLDRIVRIYPEWSRSGDGISMKNTICKPEETQN